MVTKRNLNHLGSCYGLGRCELLDTLICDCLGNADIIYKHSSSQVSHCPHIIKMWKEKLAKLVALKVKSKLMFKISRKM